MVIKIHLFNVDRDEKKYYRQVKPIDYPAYVAGFYANRDNYQGGIMSIVRGKTDHVAHAFGKISGYNYQGDV